MCPLLGPPTVYLSIWLVLLFHVFYLHSHKYIVVHRNKKFSFYNCDTINLFFVLHYTYTLSSILFTFIVIFKELYALIIYSDNKILLDKIRFYQICFSKIISINTKRIWLNDLQQFLQSQFNPKVESTLVFIGHFLCWFQIWPQLLDPKQW